MKKIFVPLLIIIIGSCTFSGCIKDSETTTPVTYMNATIGNYIFNTKTAYPATITKQLDDTTILLDIIGYQLQTKEKVVLQITNYKGQAGTFSIAAGEANATYYHTVTPGTGVNDVSYAIGGFVTITKFTPDCIVGYFNFDTQDSLYFTNGTFTCPKPDYVAHP